MPTDAALASDLVALKSMGFNAVRKHQKVLDLTTCTALQHDGPNHLGLRCNALPGHQMALITSDYVPVSSSPGGGTSTRTGLALSCGRTCRRAPKTTRGRSSSMSVHGFGATI